MNVTNRASSKKRFVFYWLKQTVSVTFGAVTLAVICLILIEYPRFRQHMWTHDTPIPLERVIEKWGDTPFDPAKFKSGSRSTRASMAADIIRNRRYVGRPPREVIEDLGPGDKYSDPVDPLPIYTLQLPEKNWKKSATYYLHFVQLMSSDVINDVQVERRCCDDPYATFFSAKGLMTVD